MDYTQLTEETLFARYSGGDIQAFEALVSRTKGLVYTLIRRYVPNPSQADEIFQEVFLKVCKNKDQFREAVSFKSWLVTICKNTCIDQTRKQRRTLKTETLDGDTGDDRRSLSEVVASSDMGPDDVLTIQIENNELEALLDKLPLEQRETFYMKIIMDMTFEEIGQTMGCSTNTSKSRFRYALETLRALVKRRQMLLRAV